MSQHVAQFLSISRSVKVGNNLSASKMRWWSRHRITIMYIPNPKGQQLNKGVTSSQAISESKQTAIRFQELGIILCDLSSDSLTGF